MEADVDLEKRAEVFVLDPFGVQQRPDFKEMGRSSQTLLNTADTCLRRAQYRLARAVPSVYSDPSVTGTGYHGGLEHYYRARQATGGVVPDEALILDCYQAVETTVREEIDNIVRYGSELKLEGSPETVIANAQAMVHHFFAGAHYYPEGWTVLAVEQKFYLPGVLDNWYTGGVIDLVVHSEASGTVLVDQKTAGKKWNKNKGTVRDSNQPAMYADAWLKLTGDRVAGMFYDVMTYDGTFERRWCPVTDAAIESVQKKERILVPLLEETQTGSLELPGNTSSFLCSEKWCDYWRICPFGEALQ